MFNAPWSSATSIYSISYFFFSSCSLPGGDRDERKNIEEEKEKREKIMRIAAEKCFKFQDFNEKILEMSSWRSFWEIIIKETVNLFRFHYKDWFWTNFSFFTKLINIFYATRRSKKKSSKEIIAFICRCCRILWKEKKIFHFELVSCLSLSLSLSSLRPKSTFDTIIFLRNSLLFETNDFFFLISYVFSVFYIFFCCLRLLCFVPSFPTHPECVDDSFSPLSFHRYWPFHWILEFFSLVSCLVVVVEVQVKQQKKFYALFLFLLFPMSCDEVRWVKRKFFLQQTTSNKRRFKMV